MANVFVVESERVQAVLHALLTAQGHTVRCAESVLSGAEDLRSFTPDVAIIRLGIPRTAAFIAELRAIAPACRVITWASTPVWLLHESGFNTPERFFVQQCGTINSFLRVVGSPAAQAELEAAPALPRQRRAADHAHKYPRLLG
jgi:CheY-like chemotaxis protein